MKSKLLVISRGEPTNPKTWSGTPKNIFDRLSGNGGFEEVGSFNLRLFYDFFTYVVHWVMIKLAMPWYFRQPIVYGYLKNKTHRMLKQKDADAVLFIDQHCIGKGVDASKRYYCYIDSVLPPVFERLEHPSMWQKRIMRRYVKNDIQSLQQMTGIFTANQWVKDYLVQEYNIQEQVIHNVRCGANISPLMEEKDYSRHLLLIVLRLNTKWRKGLPLLLEAMPMVRKVFPDARLAVVGCSGEEQEGVDYYDGYPRSKTVELFRDSTLYVMPAQWEPLGLTYLEALANKTPIVGLNRFALPEFSGGGKYGFVVDKAEPACLADVLIDALKDEKRLKKMGDEGQHFALQSYNWDNTVANIEDIISKS